MRISSTSIKETALHLGAHGCGIASADSFADAPDGFRPTDVYSKCRSVISYFKQMPTGSVFGENPIPYTHAAYKMYEELDRISMELLRFFDAQGIDGVLIPADVPYLYWDAENKIGRGILSLKHTAVKAGLGMMGKSTIFINRDYGNMVYLGAILVGAEVDTYDTPITDFTCPEGCTICHKNCVQNAISDVGVNQKLCREYSFFKAGRDWDLYNCNACRRTCPLRLGVRKKQ